ncbi:MAG: hypothetical protein A2622_08045 [Bdellovibrionales bacterium RIFCSPHIGHO2_01_FULL_40_29]|nr:MAG: hypothetical protein A2622_08045 [Bdellovibrionales bacterium RIFCSPHIGHO2_01_FULL_40_29]OFZ35447.1 MAG: hypothetical protein A3D17_07280 [Bdellovibrionales bacterium RIFCSPHIGHO2_02_FULL_40_15]
MKYLRIVAQLQAAKVLFVSLVITALYYMMYFNSGETLQTEFSNLKAQQAAEEAKKKDTEVTIRREDEMRANLAALARDLQVVKAKLPNELLDTEMIGLVNVAANKAGITITSLSRKKDATRKDSNMVGSESVEEVVFDLSMDGPFNRFVQFIENLANEEKIIKIRNFTIDRDPSQIMDPQIKFRGEVIGFKQAQVAK